MSGVKVQTTREPARARSMPPVAAQRHAEPREQDAERDKLREILTDAPAPMAAQAAAAPEPPPDASASSGAGAPVAPPAAPPEGAGPPLTPEASRVRGSATHADLGVGDVSGTPLTSATRRAMESAFGTDFSDVRVHTSPPAGAAAEALGARAFTVGSDIAFAAGHYRPGVPSGERLIAHELAHVVQQRLAGSGGLALFPKAVSSPSHPAEREAELAASLAVRGMAVPSLTPVSGVVLRDTEGEGPAPGVVFVRPSAGSVSALREEGRAEVARAGKKAEALLPSLVTLLVVGDTVLWYGPNGHQVDAFVLRPGATIWGAGWYLATESEGLRLLEANGQRGWATWVFEKPEVGFLSNWLRPEDSRRFSERIGKEGVTVALVGIPAATPTGGTGNADTAGAERLVAGVRERLARKAAASTGAPGTGEKGEGDEEGVAPPERRAVPDRLVVWSNERGAFVNVWVDGAHTALPVGDDETVDGLEQRVQDATQGLREARNPEASTHVADGAKETGFTGKPDGKGASSKEAPQLEGGKRVANAPAYPARIINYGPDITVTGATQRFEMVLDYAPAGMTLLDQVGARMQPISYYWDIFDVTDMKPEARDAAATRALHPSGQLSRASGTGRDFERKMEDIAEDTHADVEDVLSGSALELAATWQARAAWLGVVGLSNIVRLGAASISSYIDIITTPRSEQGVGWDHEGEFLIRCVATPSADDTSVVRRASSVATFVVKVMDVNRRATEVNERGANELRRLEAERDKAQGEAREKLDARITALRKAETGTAAELGADAVKALEQRIAVADRLAADRKAGTPREQRSPEARLLDVQLELQGIPLDEYQKELRAQKEGMDARMRLIGEVDGRIPGRDFRPHVTLVSEETGQVNELIMMLGEAEGSREGARHYLLADVTAPSPRDKYVFEGRSTQAGAAGHAEAVRKAFVDFRENNGYGRGTLAIHLPVALEEAAGGPLGVEPRMRSAPGTRARAMQRLRDLATVAEIAGLVLTGPVGLAVGAVGGVAGAIVAVDSLSRKYSAGALRWDFETIMDVSSIVGGVAGVAAPALGALRNVPRWANRVERLQGLLHIYGVTQLGSSVIVIPVQLEMELAALEKQAGQLSPGQLAAKRAEAILGAVRSGLMTVGSAAQMLHPGDVDGARRTWEPEAEGAPRPVEVEAGGPAPKEGPEARVTPEGEGVTAPRREESAGTPREGEPRASGEAAPAAQPTAKSERVVRLEAELGDLQGKVSVVELGASELKGRSTRVRYRRGRFQIEVGPGADIPQIHAHLATARILLRYEGPIGHIRRLLSRVVQFFTGIPGYGTQGFESRLEVRKLRSIIDELELMQRDVEGRIEKYGDKDGASLAREADSIQRQIADLEGQLSYYESLVDSVAAGRGFVAAYEKATLKDLSGQAAELTAIHERLAKSGESSLTAIIDRAADLQSAGRMTGLEGWVRETATQLADRRALNLRISELTQAVKAAEAAPTTDRVALKAPASGTAGAFTSVLEAGAATGARVRGPNELDARNSFPPDKQALFDLWASRAARLGMKLEPMLDWKSGKGMPRARVEKVLDDLAVEVKGHEAVYRHGSNLGDPLRPDLPGVETRGNVTIRYENALPADFEVDQAKKLQAYKGEDLVLFGDTALKQSYPGIDGTLGSPPRPMQLKHIPPNDPAFPPSSVRGTAMGALEKARAAGIHHVEVYIQVEGYTLAEVEAGWSGPLTGHDVPRAPGPVFDGDVVARLEIHCKNDVKAQVELVGGQYVFTVLP